MNFRQIIATYNPIKSKSELNKVLALVERNFGVFSPDMELDIRSVIVGEDILNYFDRIIHDPNPHLEYDKPKSPPKQQNTAKEIEDNRKKKAKKKAKTERVLLSKSISYNPLRNRIDNKLLQCSDFTFTPLTREEAKAKKEKQKVSITPSSEDKNKSSFAWLNKARKEIKKKKELEKKKTHVSIIYTPMGGMNKRH